MGWAIIATARRDDVGQFASHRRLRLAENIQGIDDFCHGGANMGRLDTLTLKTILGMAVVPSEMGE